LIPFLAKHLKKDGVAFKLDPQLAMQPGVEYEGVIQEWIDEAHCAILLISQEFLSSRFINEKELPRIKERFANGEISIIPILVGNVDWEEEQLGWISKLQMLPGKPDPLINYTSDPIKWDKVKVDILTAIRHRLRDLRTPIPPRGVLPRPDKGFQAEADRKKRLRSGMYKTIGLICVLVAAIAAAAILYRLCPTPHPPLAVVTRSLGFSNYWQPQTHPDSRAVYRIRPLPDGRTVEILADFKPGLRELREGEAIVYFTQEAEKAGDVTTFQLTDLSMEIEAPPDIEVRFFLKDSSWKSGYWDFLMEKTPQPQQVSLNTETTAPSGKSPDFDANRAIALGWQFLSKTRAGQVSFKLRNVQVKLRPTNLLPTVKRWPHEQFVQQCGVDMPRIFGHHDFGRIIESGAHEGVSTNLPGLKERLDYLASKRAGLVRISLFRDLTDGLRLDQSQQIVGLDPSVYADIDAILAETARHPGMRLLPVLFEADFAAGWKRLIVNETERRYFCSRILQALFKKYAAFPQIYGIEVLGDPQKVSQMAGEKATREFVSEILKVIREVRPSWKAMIGYSSRASMDHFKFGGFDACTLNYDANNQRYEFIKVRRDQMTYPPSEIPVILIAQLPSPADRDSDAARMTFASYAIQDAFDYGYAGVILSTFEGGDGRVGFKGKEADDFAAWMSR
jgi:hypothetical protein